MKMRNNLIQLHKGLSKQQLSKKQNKGMSMVEVLVGFVILVGILGGLSGSIAFAQNMYMKSVDLHREQAQIMKNIYKKNLFDGKTPSQTELKLYVINSPKTPAGNETITDAKFSNGDEVKLGIECYRMPASAVNNEGDSDVAEMTFYLFHKTDSE